MVDGAEGLVIKAVDALPIDLEELLAPAEAEGFLALPRLAREWRERSNRFDRPGEALFEARRAGLLLGVCGLNVDPFASSGTKRAPGRVRRLFVRPEARRKGVARALVDAVVAAARGPFATLQLRTYAADADAFYVAYGFERVDSDAHVTHRLAL